MKRLKNERGLTLVELLAVVVILGIIATIAFVYIGGVIENSKKDAHIANAIQIISATKLYEASGGELDEQSTGGGSGETFEQIELSTLIDEQFLQPLIDPWNTSSNYGQGAKVYKSEAGYIIENFNGEDCKLNVATEVSEQQLLEKGRELCTNN